MEKVSLRFTGAIILSLIVAFALSIIPLRESWILWRPEWIALTFFHWGLYKPKKTSLLLAWFIGLIIDATQGSTLGQHAFGFTIVMFMTLRVRPRMLVDSYLHQIFWLFVILVTYLLVNLWILGFTGNSPAGWGYWLTVISSMIIWPFYNYALRFFHSKKKPF